MEKNTTSASETQKLAKGILGNLGSANVICLYGAIGVGKTTLTQGLARELGITAKIISPTFVLIRQYSLSKQFKFQRLFHVDLYRLEEVQQIKDLGIEEIWQDKSNLVIIEWAEKLGELFPAHHLEIRMKTITSVKRSIHFQSK